MRYFWPTWCHWCLYNKIIIIIIIPPGLLVRFLFCNISLCRLSRDKMKMRSLKDRYENFLEEEKRRLARNDKLLQTMEDIDYRASTLAAKTERLKLLKVSTLGIQYKRLTTPTRLPPPNRKLTHPPEIRESTFWWSPDVLRIYWLMSRYSCYKRLFSRTQHRKSRIFHFWFTFTVRSTYEWCQLHFIFAFEQKRSLSSSTHPFHSIPCALTRNAYIKIIPCHSYPKSTESNDRIGTKATTKLYS